MAGLMDRLAAAKAAQEASADKRAAEKAQAEKESKKGELAQERERVAAEITATEKDAAEAEHALQEVAQMESQGELDDDVKAELAAIRTEARTTQESFKALQSRLQTIDAEIATLSPEAPATETKAAEAPAATETPITQATPAATTVEEAPAAEAQPSAQPEASAAENIENMSADDLKKKLSSEVNTPLASVQEWYNKILSGTSALADEAFAQGQIAKLQGALETMGHLGQALIRKQEQAGKPSAGIQQNMEKLAKQMNELIVKISDRVALTSGEVSEEDALKQLHPETMREDVNTIVDVSRIGKMMSEAQQFRAGLGKKEDIARLADINASFRESTQALDDKIKLLSRWSKTVGRQHPNEAAMKAVYDLANTKKKELEILAQKLDRDIDLEKKRLGV